AGRAAHRPLPRERLLRVRWWAALALACPREPGDRPGWLAARYLAAAAPGRAGQHSAGVPHARPADRRAAPRRGAHPAPGVGLPARSARRRLAAHLPLG